MTKRCTVCGWHPRGITRAPRTLRTLSHVVLWIMPSGLWCVWCTRRLGDPRQLELFESTIEDKPWTVAPFTLESR